MSVVKVPDSLYYFGSEKPMSGSGEGWSVYVSLPLSLAVDCHRYANLVILEFEFRPGDFMDLPQIRACLPHSYSFLGLFTED